MQFLLPVFEHTNAIYDVRKIGGIYSFLDGFSGEKKSVSDYDMLHELGLRRVYIGLESGDEDLLKFLHKPGKPADVLDAVRNMKEAGINVGVIILVGAGGHEYADKHVSNTLDIVGKMPLDRGDIVYLSELVIDEQMPYATAAGLASIAPFDSQALEDQTHMLKTGLRSRLGRNGPIISRYDIREFIY